MFSHSQQTVLAPSVIPTLDMLGQLSDQPAEGFVAQSRNKRKLTVYGEVWAFGYLINYRCKFCVPIDYLAHLKHEIIQRNHFRVVSLEMFI